MQDLRLDQNISLWKNQRQCPRWWGSKTGNTEVLSPGTREGKRPLGKRSWFTSRSRGEPKITVWTEGDFWDAATRSRSRICIHGPKEKHQRERREFSKAPLHLEIIFSLQKLGLSLFLKIIVFSWRRFCLSQNWAWEKWLSAAYSTRFASTETCGEVCGTVQ